jgi:hypothetical protein
VGFGPILRYYFDQCGIANIIDVFHIESQLCHNDTTSVSMYGDADNNKTDQSIQVTFGHSKKHRKDLKQLIWSMSVSSNHALPVNKKPYKTAFRKPKRHLTDIYTQPGRRTSFFPIGPGIKHLRSITGEPSKASISSISMEPPWIEFTLQTVSPIKLGLCGEWVAKTPVKGLRGSFRG